MPVLFLQIHHVDVPAGTVFFIPFPRLTVPTRPVGSPPPMPAWWHGPGQTLVLFQGAN